MQDHARINNKSFFKQRESHTLKMNNNHKACIAGIYLQITVICTAEKLNNKCTALTSKSQLSNAWVSRGHLYPSASPGWKCGNYPVQ